MKNDHNGHYLKNELYQLIKKDHRVFDFIQEGCLDGIWYWNLEKIEDEWMSPRFWKTLGYNPEEMKHSSSAWQGIIFKDDFKRADENFEKHCQDATHPYDQIVRYRHKDGSTVWIRCRGIAIRDSQGVSIRMLGAHTNITDVMESHEEIDHLKTEYETVFNGSQDALFLIEVNGVKNFTFKRNNRAHQISTGITQAMFAGSSPRDFLENAAAEEVISHYQTCVDSQAVTSYEETLSLPGGKRIWSTTLTPITEAGNVTHIVGSSVDITQQKELEEELQRRANYDSLTALANRDYLIRYLKKITASSKESLLFLFIDLDGFKEINDAHGHAAGDQVLKRVAEKMICMLDQDDFAARVGGDEFVILKKGTHTGDEVDAFIRKVNEHIQEPVRVAETQLSVASSIGYSRFPIDGRDYDKLSRHADAKMYEIKKTKPFE